MAYGLRRTKVRAVVAVAMALAAMSACKLEKPVGTSVAGGEISTLKSVVFQLRLPGGALPASVLVGGKPYKVGAGGQLALSPDLLAKAGPDGLLLLVPGAAPQRLKPGQPNQPVELVPAPPLGPALTASADQAFAQAGVGLRFTSELLPRPTPIAVSTYPSDEAQALGLTILVDGHIGTGTLPVSLDLGAWTRGWDGKAPAPWLAAPDQWTPNERARAAFAAQALTAAAALTPAERKDLADTFGVTVTGQTMALAVKLDDAVTQGAVRVEVDGLKVLGVALSITVISSATAEALPSAFKPPVLAVGPTPAVALPSTGVVPDLQPSALPLGPGNVVSIVSDNGGGLLCRGAGALFSANVKLISDHGGGILANNGGNAVPRELISGLVSNNGGGLVGKVKAPNLAAHFGLLAAFPVVAYPQIRVSLPYLEGSPSVLADANGNYRFDNLPESGPNLVVVAKDPDQTLLTLCPAPGSGQVTADLNPDTTAVAAEALLRLLAGCSDAPTFYLPGYVDAVARVAALPTYDLPAYSRLQSQLYKPPAATTPGAYSFGAPWANQLGCTYVTARQTVQANSPNWYVVAAGLPAGAHVGFDCDLNTTFNGVNWIDYTGDPAFGGNGRLVVQMPGFTGTFPRGQVLTLPSAGDVSVQYQDDANAPPGYTNNQGSIATRFDINRCP